ncbi:calponin homology domain-containing protein DDB_G0272472-like isoform X3 [Mya arenaria]|uniref:calponin homology domain-containing protein DDB_G0272472-like isoform X3 n=1 Tax=Mya arenaria TaxID=6604 RepID=UPI0022E604C3|nr:calponin homology domain-containing protein DDB_G0272472-like isoform X3 [Mya arenaria]
MEGNKRRIRESRQSQHKDKEIENRTSERAELLERIRAQDEEILKAMERERNQQIKIEEQEKECERMKESCSRWDPLLKERKDELRAIKAELKDFQDKNGALEEELIQQRRIHDEKDEIILKLIEEKSRSRKDETIQRLNEKNFSFRLWLVCLLICIAIAVFLGFNTTQLSTECPDRKWNISILGNTFISGT